MLNYSHFIATAVLVPQKQLRLIELIPIMELAKVTDFKHVLLKDNAPGVLYLRLYTFIRLEIAYY